MLRARDLTPFGCLRLAICLAYEGRPGLDTCKVGGERGINRPLQGAVSQRLF